MGGLKDWICGALTEYVHDPDADEAELAESIFSDRMRLESTAYTFREMFAREDREGIEKTPNNEKGDVSRVAMLIRTAKLCIQSAIDIGASIDLTEQEVQDIARGDGIRWHLFGWDDPDEGKTGKGVCRRVAPDYYVYDSDVDRSTSTDRMFDSFLQRLDAAEHSKASESAAQN